MAIGRSENLRGKQRPIERPLESVFHKTEMKIWVGQNFLAAHIVYLKGQHVLS